MAKAQQSAASTTSPTTKIAISNAELGAFPYIKNFPNFKSRNQSDSVTVEKNLVYFFDGKTVFTVEGKVSAQKLTVNDDKKVVPSEFQIEQDFDKLISTLGGKKSI